jgi:LmbE family N-acetylglucosaminyl deacetylase
LTESSGFDEDQPVLLDGVDRDAPPRLMVVVAHPDDETFGCGSLLLHAAAIGMTTTVVCATHGEAGERADPTGDAQSDLSVVREGELRAAAHALGVTRVDLLEFRDSGMSGDLAPGSLCGVPLEDVRDRVIALLDEVGPHVVVTLDAGDGHRDHVRIRDATLAAVDAARWHVTSVYLQCFPKSLMQRWVDHMATSDPTWEHLDIEVPGTPDELVTDRIDTSEFVDQREAAIAMHASQRSPYDGLPDELRRAFLTTEYLRRVRPT